VATIVPPFTDAHLQEISRVLADAATGPELTRLFATAQLADQLGDGATKWKRIRAALTERQQRDGNGNGACSFVMRAMEPVRFSTDPGRFSRLRDELNVRLAFAGLHLREDGKIARDSKATTLADAEQRANLLRSTLRERRVHPDVLAFCRRELLQQNYFHAVFEATKSIAEKIRTRSGYQSDGSQLVDDAFGLSKGMPALAFNTLQSATERSEHVGLMMLIKGMFSTFRNTTAHAPSITWPIGLDDALDLLTLVSMLHRRIDAAVVTHDAPSRKV
jgi:uncharacterized protein (TIGR02391 family)